MPELDSFFFLFLRIPFIRFIFFGGEKKDRISIWKSALSLRARKRVNYANRSEKAIKKKIFKLVFLSSITANSNVTRGSFDLNKFAKLTTFCSNGFGFLPRNYAAERLINLFLIRSSFERVSTSKNFLLLSLSPPLLLPSSWHSISDDENKGSREKLTVFIFR